MCHLLLVATMGDRVVSFSPVKRVLTYSPTEAVTEVGKSKKKRSVIMPDDVPNSAMSDVVPLMDVTSKKGKSTLVKKIKELKLKKKAPKEKEQGKEEDDYDAESVTDPEETEKDFDKKDSGEIVFKQENDIEQSGIKNEF